jgi:hypothetical protein
MERHLNNNNGWRNLCINSLFIALFGYHMQQSYLTLRGFERASLAPHVSFNRDESSRP